MLIVDTKCNMPVHKAGATTIAGRVLTYTGIFLKDCVYSYNYNYTYSTSLRRTGILLSYFYMHCPREVQPLLKWGARLPRLGNDAMRLSSSVGPKQLMWGVPKSLAIISAVVLPWCQQRVSKTGHRSSIRPCAGLCNVQAGLVMFREVN